MLLALGMAAALAAAPPAQSQSSPYLDALRAYGPGEQAGRGIRALLQLGLDGPGHVFDQLDDRQCRAAGARSCRARDVDQLEPGRRAELFAAWRRLYPRALAVHIEALGATDPVRHARIQAVHRAVVIRLTERLDEIAALREAPPEFAHLATLGRHLLVWALQFLRDEPGLSRALETLVKAAPADPELALARGVLEELRMLPESIAAAERREERATERSRSIGGGPAAVIETTPTIDERRREEPDLPRLAAAAVRAYERALDAAPPIAETHLRLGRLLAMLEKYPEADRHLQQARALGPDARQQYLAALFLADLRERQDRPADAIAEYARALRLWPGSQAPALGLARLQVLAGQPDTARATLKDIHAERDMRERSDPWLGYDGGQGWRVPPALVALQRSFTPWP
jgi:tetratricopeptide (TPR) repeat protein